VITVDLEVPRRVLAVGAHPDDVEFGCGATLAKWSEAGADVQLCVCTDGSKGTWDATQEVAALVARREGEQRSAAGALGASAVHFLRYVDGELTEDLGTRAALCAVIREVKPDVVLTHDPWKVERIHPDHRIAGTLTIDAIVAARDPHFFPEQELAPHRPSTLLLFEASKVTHVERVQHHIERKIVALLHHRSQWQSTMGIDADPEREQSEFAQRLVDRAQAEGIRAGVRAAEAFRRVEGL